MRGSKPGHRMAIIYARVSTKLQVGNYSIPEQIETMTRILKAKGYTNIVVREELGVSGETIKDRPVLQLCIKDIESDDVDVLASIDLTRLSRDKDVIDGLEIRRICAEHNVLIITKEMTYDCTKQETLMLYVMGLLGSAIQKHMNVGNTARGLRKCAEEGELFNGVVPFGIDRVLEPFGPKQRLKSAFVVNEAEAEVVRQIFAKVHDMGTSKVAAWLNSQGVVRPVKSPGTRMYLARRFGHLYATPPATRPWRGSDVLSIIHNPIYRGIWEWGRTWKSAHYKDQEDHISLPMERLRIVSDPIWVSANAVLDRRSQVPPRASTSPYLFSGVLKCNRCGGPMTGHRRRGAQPDLRVPIYRCSNHKDGLGCAGNQITERLARRAVRRHLTKLLAGVRIEGAIDRAITDHLGKSSVSERIQNLEQQLSMLQEQGGRILELWAQQEITDDERASQMARIRDAQERTKKALAREQRALRHDISAEQLREYIGADLMVWVRRLSGQRLSRVSKLVYGSFQLEADGKGWSRKAKVAAHTLTGDFAAVRRQTRLLTSSSH